MSQQIGLAAHLPVSEPTPVVSISPVTLRAPARVVDLEMRVSAPASGDELPIILLSHGFGRSNNLSSLNGYGPLANFYAAHGFAVVQPTHLSSKSLALDPTGPEGALFWRSRAQDMSFIIDQLDAVEASVPMLRGRLDKGRIAVVGHSMGGHTAAMLAGMEVTDPVTGREVNLVDPRVRASVLLGVPGNGADLAQGAADHYPVLKGSNFATMTAPVMVVNGDKDVNPMFTDRIDWRADAYYLSPGPKTLLTIIGGEHIFGGISGYDAAETSDENPERVAVVQRLTWAYLRSALYDGDTAWSDARAALGRSAAHLATVESR